MLLTRQVLALVPLMACGLLAFYSFVAEGRLVYACVFGLIVPIGAAFESRALRERGYGEAVDRLLPLVAIALFAAGL